MKDDTRREAIQSKFSEAARIMSWLESHAVEFVLDAADMIETSLKNGGRFFTCGNGGSAADAQHIAAELSGKFYRDRPGLAAVALTVNTSALTAIGNDFDYEQVFSRQMEGLARTGDVLLAITTSGGSRNVVAAVAKARELGVKVIGLTGERGTAFASTCDLALVVPSPDTPRIQEAHIAAGHLICERVEAAMFPEAS